VRPYWAVLRARFLALLQYRVAALAGLATQVFWGFVRVMIFAAFYRSAAGPQPMTYEEVVSYVWLGQATILLVLWRPDPEIEEMVRSGNVAYELLRPVDLYGMWLARGIASRAAPLILRAVPLVTLSALFFGLGPPASFSSLLAWLASLVAAILLSGAIATLLTITLLWTISGRGIAILVTTGLWALSGIILPIPLLPDWAQPVVEALPFRGLMDTPIRLYLGHMTPSEVLPALAHQLGWTLALILFSRALLGLGRRRLVVQGG